MAALEPLLREILQHHASTVFPNVTEPELAVVYAGTSSNSPFQLPLLSRSTFKLHLSFPEDYAKYSDESRGQKMTSLLQDTLNDVLGGFLPLDEGACYLTRTPIDVNFASVPVKRIEYHMGVPELVSSRVGSKCTEAGVTVHLYPLNPTWPTEELWGVVVSVRGR